jgi:L-aminopeptidase/D-esterase-like protein
VGAAAGASAGSADGPDTLQATTIGIIVTNARVDKVGCLRLAQSGHDGLARALDPVHTGGDGDALVAAATGEVDAPLETVRALAAWVVEQAVLDAVPPPAGPPGGPG